ncbi:hypothetical protein LJC55_03945 [Eubacteriales bacterium OttesenSCG-928-N14]|nr:hypothetical protein [Eubacteriales bacterium OttesenSCG-928-N14]
MRVKKRLGLFVALLLCILIPTVALASRLQEEDVAQQPPHETVEQQEQSGEDAGQEQAQEDTQQLEQSEDTEQQEGIQEDAAIEDAAQQEDAAAQEEQPPVETPAPLPNPLNTSGYVVLEDGISAVVYTYEQLREAIEQDNGITTVYLGADFTILRNRIEINAKKAQFTLCGTNPLTGTRHTLTEYRDPGLANIVLANGNTTTKKITLCDINVKSQGSYYGIMGVEDGVRGVEYIVRNVHYTGRQFIYAIYANIVFEGENTIIINQSTNGNAGQELGEFSNVTVRGSLRIEFYSTGYPVFKMNFGKTSFAVEGQLSLIAPNLPAAAGVIQGSGGDNAVDFTVKQNGSVHIVANNRLFYEEANTLTVEKNASFHYEKTGGLNGDLHAAIRLRQKLVVGEGATFYLKQAASGASYFIRFYNVPTALSGGVMEFDNPKLVTLIHEGARPMVYGAKKEQFNAVFEYLNYWTKAQGAASDAPQYAYDMSQTPNYAPIWLQLVHTAGKPSSLSSNHEGITAANFLLDATPGTIVFGQLQQVIVLLEGRHEQTGDVMADFTMPPQTAERNGTAVITPQSLLGYVVTGYGVDGGQISRMQQKQITLTADKGVILITIYYSEPVLDVSVPTKLIFTSYQSDAGQIHSPDYSFVNHSNADVTVVLQQVQVAEDGGLSLAPFGQGEGEQVSLGIQPKDETRFAFADFAVARNEAVVIGTLNHKWSDTGREYVFSLVGQYHGGYETAQHWPKYQLQFEFIIQ